MFHEYADKNTDNTVIADCCIFKWSNVSGMGIQTFETSFSAVFSVDGF
jgi:hypothetical protein